MLKEKEEKCTYWHGKKFVGIKILVDLDFLLLKEETRFFYANGFTNGMLKDQVIEISGLGINTTVLQGLI